MIFLYMEDAVNRFINWLKENLLNHLLAFTMKVSLSPIDLILINFYNKHGKLKTNTATGLDGWRPSEFKQLPNCLLSALLDVYKLCELSGHFPSSFYFSYTTLIPKGTSRTPLNLRPITVLPVPYRIYASLRCQTLLTWQNSWIHSSQFAFCKGRSTTSLNSHLSFDLLNRFQTYGAFAGVQFDFAKCFDSIPYTVIWDTLKYHGCDPNLIVLLQNLYTHMNRCFRYAGCVGSFWRATNGLLQGDPLSVVILNCVLCPLLRQLASIPDLTVYAFADDLTIVSSSWDTLNQAYQLLRLFCASTDLVLNVSKCQLWNKGSPQGTYPLDFDQFAFCFYPFLLGSPIDIGVPYSDSLQQHDENILARARKIAKLSLPYRVIYRLFVSLVSSCYNHYALSCDMTPAQSNSFKHAVTSILVPKRSKWVCREALYSLATPGHLLSPQLFLNYRHIIEYLLYVRQTAPSHRHHLSNLWIETLHIKWGPLFRLRKAAQSFSFTFEDPFVLLVYDEAHSVDEPLDSLKHLIRDSYRQALLSQAAKRRQDCHGKTHPIHIELTRTYYFSLTQPLHQSLLRQILTGAIDHHSRLFKSNCPLCPFCNTDETARHIFWDCNRWQSTRSKFPNLLRLFHLVGSQRPNCFLHCGWFEQGRNYGLSLLESLQITFDQDSFVRDTHQMYFHILLCRYEATQVLQSTPVTPPDLQLTSSISSSPPLSPHFVQLQGDVSPISVRSSEPG